MEARNNYLLEKKATIEADQVPIAASVKKDKEN